MFELANVREYIPNALDCKLEIFHVFNFYLDPIKDLEKFENLLVVHRVHAVDSSKFSGRVNRESEENLRFRKSLILAGLRRGRGPHRA